MSLVGRPRFAPFVVLAISSVLVGACATGLFSSRDVQASARALVVQPDGKLVLAGPAGVGTKVAFALARYLPDGRLDPAFGSGGRVLTPFKDTPFYARVLAGAYVRGLGIQPDGKLVAAGVASIGGFAGVGFRLHYALARYRADGSLDPDFGTGGTLTNHVEQTTYNVPTFALQPDGKLVVAGEELVGTRAVFALVRFLPDGRVDRRFGTDGKVTTDIRGSHSYSSIRAIAVQPDGKLVAAGFSVVDGRDCFALARYSPDGSLDMTFGRDGMVTATIVFGAKGLVTPGFVSRGAFAVAVQPDGKLVAAGATEALHGRAVFALGRFLGNGSLDQSFATSGTWRRISAMAALPLHWRCSRTARSWPLGRRVAVTSPPASLRWPATSRTGARTAASVGTGE